MQLQSFLFDQLWHLGVRHVFGIPGDFAVPIFDAFQADGRFQLVRLSHEPAIGFAADGCARMSGTPSVCCVTYGAGALNMVNPVACAYSEESPLVVLSGGPGVGERRAGVHVHHQVKSFDSQLRVYKEVTAYAVILDDTNTAATHIARALETAATRKRPVYLEIPRDMVFADIAPPHPEHLRRRVDEGAVNEAVAEIAARLKVASRPLVIVGVEVHRFDLREQVIRLAETLQTPVASSFLGRGVFPTRHPLFIGTYLGLASPNSLRAVVEGSDCVLLIGEQISDTSLGVSAQCLDGHNLVTCVAQDVFIGHHRYEHVSLERVVSQLIAFTPSITTNERAASPGSIRPVIDSLAIDSTVAVDPGPITMTGVIGALNEFADAHPDVPLVADTGDALFASVEVRVNECVAPAYYATMGFAIPAALGIQISSRRRPLVMVGDGAFQMTGPEIAYARNYSCNPVIVLLNNSRWEMLQAFSSDACYNAIVSWPYSRLIELWGGHGFEARTGAELRLALAQAWKDDRPVLIEVPLRAGDISSVLQRFVTAFREALARPARSGTQLSRNASYVDPMETRNRADAGHSRLE
jgi:indolepyruvate decarboxylase